MNVVMIYWCSVATVHVAALIVQHFGEYAYSLSFQELDENMKIIQVYLCMVRLA